MLRRRFKQNKPLRERLADEANRLREAAKLFPPGVERERLIRKARQNDTASHMDEWLGSPGLQAPSGPSEASASVGTARRGASASAKAPGRSWLE